MNAQELTTWNRLRALDLDAAGAALPFSARLARDNGWSHAFAAQAIDEYRKFCFLAVHAGHPVTPSDEVDQVWHLHLLYSQHYWETLCRDTLEMPLHHGPTRGGAAEGQKYHSWYDDTLASYRRYFGEPPRDFWPAARERFHEAHDFVRVDRRDVVTVDRALLRRGAVTTLIGGSVLAVTHALAQADDGGASAIGVWLVGLVLAAVVVAGVVAAVRGSAARKRNKRAAAAGATGACGYLAGAPSSKDSNGGDDDSGGQSGCGAASGCSGGGGGCGGGGGGAGAGGCGGS
ncbi:MAG TPA: hypothetical protein VKA43_05640 [Gammaproteobacteria bacterium]|nr:hypothetical protein [Gammaproteobacteria bacterium]